MTPRARSASDSCAILLYAPRILKLKTGCRSSRFSSSLLPMLAELRNALSGIRLLRHCPPRALDVVASFGEQLSALIVAGYLDRFRRAVGLDARTFVITDDQFTEANVLLDKTNRLARRVLAPF